MRLFLIYIYIRKMVACAIFAQFIHTGPTNANRVSMLIQKTKQKLLFVVAM